MIHRTKYMVETQLKPRGVSDPRVLDAITKVPREKFVPESYKSFAYSDCPLPISDGQTISQPYMVAAMTELLRLDSASTVLEIGSGSGYQTAILAEIAHAVYTVEIVANLASGARARLTKMGYENIFFKEGDGYRGWPEHAPFDAIVVTAAPDKLPSAYQEQLKPGGRLVIPVGPCFDVQTLYLYHKGEDGRLSGSSVMDVRFVPLTGKH